MTATKIAENDITLTIDPDGVIKSAVSSEALADESLVTWHGQPWSDTIDPAISAEVAQMMKDVRRGGASSRFTVKQRFPSGRELSIEYTTISLGEKTGFIAIGKNVQAILDLQTRLQLAHQAREQDYWKLREIERRYRLLFDASNEAVVLVRVTNLRIVEVNLAATQALGLLPGAEFYPAIQPNERKLFHTTLEQVREHGRVPGIVLHFGTANAPWSLRASMISNENGSYYLFQIVSIGASAPIVPKGELYPSEEIFQRFPDGFAIVDQDCIIRRVNHTFLDLVQIGAEGVVLGQSMKRWLSHPGSDISILLNLVQRQGSVRQLSTTLYGELGTKTEVEISAVGNKDKSPEYIGLLLHDVTIRPRIETHGRNDTSTDTVTETPSLLEVSGKELSLDQLIKASTASIEKRMIAETLEQAGGNRTATAKRLGLSRQSLHTKLNKYNLE
jgi:transcriptional regulator PpsR